MDSRSEVEARIRTLAEHGWSQQRIAQTTGVSQASISRILAGAPVSDQTLDRLGLVTSDLAEFINVQNRLYEDMGRLDAATQQLDGDKTSATVLFLDLEGSTGYRQKHGAPKGLAKAHRHNLMVSQSITRNRGEVVKWIGDGVMGVFCGEADERPHPYRALRAALEAIRDLHQYNQRRHGATREWEEEIHTRAALSAGQVHFIRLGADAATSPTAGQNDSGQQQSPLTFSDPIGGSVDLAARLQQAATSDAIVIDTDTFFGIGRAAGIAPISLTPAQDIAYCALMLEGERTTMYKPYVAAFSHAERGIEFFAVEPAGDKAELGTFQKGAQEQAIQKGKEIVFLCAPVKCNVGGFAQPVEVVAVSLDARDAPVRHLAYTSPSSEEIKALLDSAEMAHRLGKIDESVRLYQEVFEKDRRDFRANARLAQHYRSLGQVQDAERHWNVAMESDATRAIVWAAAGATYFEGYLLDQSRREGLDRAVVDFGRARLLAAEAFDSLLEQHCSMMLVLSLLLRNQGNDLPRAKAMMDAIQGWPPLSQATRVLKGLVEVLFLIATGTPKELSEGQKKLEILEASLVPWDGGAQDRPDVAEDNNSVLLSRGRLSVLLELAAFRLKAGMFLLSRPAAAAAQDSQWSEKSPARPRPPRDRRT